MAKIFLTGMTAAQCSQEVNSKNLNFAGVVHKVLTEAGHDVTWGSPSVFMPKEYFNNYDAVIVGVAPSTSLSSNRIYGALSVIDVLWGDPKLTLFVDVPTLRQIGISFKSFVSNSENITKQFFSARKEYKFVVEDEAIFSRVRSGAEKISNNDWGTTLYPALPWKTLESIKLPPNAKANLVKINLDSYLIGHEISIAERAQKWCCDEPKSRWIRDISNHLSMAVVPMKFDKKSGDVEIMYQINRSSGVLIAPDQKDGTYWNYRYIQAMNSGAPIATQWQESHVISEAWGVLASTIDVMNSSQREFVALAQRETYLSAIPEKKKALEILETVIGIHGKEK